MRKILTFFSIIIFTGCAIDYENNRRSHFTGSLVDENGNPIENTRVELLVETFGFKNSNFPVINSTETDENGNFDLLSIEPKNKVLFMNFGSDILPFLRLRESGGNNGPFYDLGELRINIPARFDIIFINENGSEESVYVEYNYRRYKPLNNFPPGWINAYHFNEQELPDNVQNTRTITPNPEYDLTINTLLDSEINVRFSIGEPLAESEDIQELNFTISESLSRYEVIY